MAQQTYGQQLLHTDRPSANPTVQELKEQAAQIIDDLHFQKEQTSNLNAKRWLGKSILYFENAVYYAEQAISVPQPHEVVNGSQYRQKRQRQMQTEMS